MVSALWESENQSSGTICKKRKKMDIQVFLITASRRSNPCKHPGGGAMNVIVRTWLSKPTVPVYSNPEWDSNLGPKCLPLLEFETWPLRPL